MELRQGRQPPTSITTLLPAPWKDLPALLDDVGAALAVVDPE